MRAILFTKSLPGKSWREAKDVTYSIHAMLDHIRIDYEGERIWVRNGRCDLSKDYSGNWSLSVTMDMHSLPTWALSQKLAIKVRMEESEANFHLPYWKLNIAVKRAAKDHVTLRVK